MMGLDLWVIAGILIWSTMVGVLLYYSTKWAVWVTRNLDTPQPRQTSPIPEELQAPKRNLFTWETTTYKTPPAKERKYWVSSPRIARRP